MTDIYGFRVIVPTVVDCYTALGVLHQLYKPLPGKFRTTSPLPSSMATSRCIRRWWPGRCQCRVPDAHRSHARGGGIGVAAHWLYKADQPGRDAAERLGTKWLQSLLDIQDETRDAAEFWDHVKVDLFPMRSMCLRPRAKSWPCRAAPRWWICLRHPQQCGTTPFRARINGEQVALRTELKMGMWWKSSPNRRPRPIRPGCPLYVPAGPVPNPPSPQDAGAYRVGGAG